MWLLKHDQQRVNILFQEEKWYGRMDILYNLFLDACNDEIYRTT